MDNDLILVVSGIVLILIVILVSAVSAYREASRSLDVEKRTTLKLEKAESQIQENPDRIKPLWDIARITLESYLSKNIAHINSIFWISVVAMIAGLVIILWGVTASASSDVKDSSIWIAGGAGVITEFLGATFLFIYRSTIEQAMKYLETLERINAVGMAMQILESIPDDADKEDLKNKTKSVIVEKLIDRSEKSVKE